MTLKSFLFLFIVQICYLTLLQNNKEQKQSFDKDLKLQIDNLLKNFNKKHNRNLEIKKSKEDTKDKKRKLKETQDFIATVQTKLRKLMPNNFDSEQFIDFQDDNFLQSLIDDIGLAFSQNQNEVMVDPKIFHLMIKYLAVLQHLRQGQQHEDQIEILKNDFQKNQVKIAKILQKLQDADDELSTIKGYRKVRKNSESAIEQIEDKKKVLIQQLKQAQLQNNLQKEQDDINKVVKKLEQGEQEVSKKKMSAQEKLDEVKQLQLEKKKLLKLEEFVKERVKAYKTIEDIEDRIETIDSKMSDLIQKGIHADQINNLENQKQELLGVLYKEKQVLQEKRDYYKLLHDQQLLEIDEDEKGKQIEEIKVSKEFKKFLKDSGDLIKLEDQDSQKKIIIDSYLILDNFLKKIEELQQEFRIWFDVIEQENTQQNSQEDTQEDQDFAFRNDLKLYSKMVTFSQQMSLKEKRILQILKLLYNSWNDFDINNEEAVIKFYELQEDYQKISEDDFLSDEEELNDEIKKKQNIKFQKQNKIVKIQRKNFHKEFDDFFSKQETIVSGLKMVVEYNTQLATSINDFLLVKENENNLSAQNLIFQSKKFYSQILDSKKQILENLVNVKTIMKEMIFQKDYIKKHIDKIYEALQQQQEAKNSS